MGTIHQDIETMRGMTRNTWRDGNLTGWLACSLVLLVWRVARAVRWAR
jgi:hypothetical protein